MNEQIITTQIEYNSLDEMDSSTRSSLISTYINIFKENPYLEQFEPEQVKEFLTTLTESKSGSIFVVQEGDDVVAFGAGYLNTGDNTFWIEELGTDEQFRRQGYASQILESFISNAQKLNAERVSLRTTERNQRAIPLYESFGFQDSQKKVLVPQTRTENQPGIDIRSYYTLSLNDAPDPLEFPTRLENVRFMFPNGNPTALILDQNVDRVKIGEQLRVNYPEIEQVGFISTAVNSDSICSVQMEGGEFCGNATRSAIQVTTQGLPGKGKIDFIVENEPLQLFFEVLENGEIEVDMPIPKDIQVEETSLGKIVRLEGITQLIVERVFDTIDTEDIKAEGRRLIFEAGLQDETATGVMFFDRKLGAIEPVVRVNTIEKESLYYESACGSGTCAIGIAEALSLGESIEIPVLQPSGQYITVGVEIEGGKIIRSYIRGIVDETFSGKIDL